jgi:hypothetical protein
MKRMASPSAYRERKKLVDTVRRMLSGDVSFLEGARMIRDSGALEVDDFDEDILPFVVIVSETDRFPLGEVRQLWDPDALAKLQPEIDSAEKWAIETAGRHCQRLIDRFGPEAVRRQIGETARAMLKAEVSFIAGAHRIVFLRAYADLPESDPDFVSIVQIDSKFESLPPSDGREHWAREVLDEKYPEIGRAEEWSRQAATADCQRLIDRFIGEELPSG